MNEQVSNVALSPPRTGIAGTKALQTTSIVVGLPIVIIEMLALIAVVVAIHRRKTAG